MGRQGGRENGQGVRHRCPVLLLSRGVLLVLVGVGVVAAGEAT
jgi:hypothetical protein